jgi:hypothetical protein
MKKKGVPKKGFEAMSDGEACRLVEKAWIDFEGDCAVFMSAVGALMLGRAVGWQGVRVCMSAATYRKYEGILGVRFRDVLPERCHDSPSVRGIRIVDGFGKFWQALSGGLVPAMEGKLVAKLLDA